MVKFSNQTKHQSDCQQRGIRGKRSEACVAMTEQTNSCSNNPTSNFDNNMYAFMTISRRSHALSVNLDKKAWFADSGATEHRTKHRDWFSTFKSIP